MSSGMSRRNLFGTFAAAALGWSADRAKPQHDAGDDSTCAVTTYVYDSKGQLLEVIEPFTGEVTSWTYDNALPWPSDE